MEQSKVKKQYVEQNMVWSYLFQQTLNRHDRVIFEERGGSEEGVMKKIYFVDMVWFFNNGIVCLIKHEKEK